MISSAAGVRRVISSTDRPPATQRARQRQRRRSTASIARTGTTGVALSSVAEPRLRERASADQAVSSCQVRPSRSISAIAADGPQVPAV